MIWFKLAVLHILFYKEENTMAVIYATLIVKGLRTFESVPAQIKGQVKEILEALEVPELAADTAE